MLPAMERRATARPASARAVLLGAEISTMGRSIGSPVPVLRRARGRRRASGAVRSAAAGRGGSEGATESQIDRGKVSKKSRTRFHLFFYMRPLNTIASCMLVIDKHTSSNKILSIL